MLSHRRLGTLTATIIGAAAIGVAAQASAATADGSSVDDNFLAETTGQGIDFSPQDSLSDAHIVGQGLGNGDDPEAIVDDILATTDLNLRQTILFVVDSAQADCPGDSSKLPPNGTRLAAQSI
jgi:NAD(P)H-hydrate repair Nnr-like enzyme with NAD(P)H-hydrate dehydratase domain